MSDFESVSPSQPDFEKAGGLVPVVTQEAETGVVLMLAWMDREAWNATLNEGVAVYFSRSRNCLWRKGERSGRVQFVKEIFLDCDRDTVLLKVEQRGEAACHTGRKSCFYRKIGRDGSVDVVYEPLFDPDEVYGRG